MNNYVLLIDFYEFLMVNGYLVILFDDCWVVFDVFFWIVFDDGSFVIVVGLVQVVD